MSTRLKTITLASIASLLSACVASPGTLARLSQLSPLDTNPSDLRIAVRTPVGFELGENDLRMLFAYARHDGAPGVEERFSLDIGDPVGAAPGVGVIDVTRERLVVSALGAADAARFREAQTRIKALKAAGIDGTGTLAVEATGCIATGPLERPIPLSAYLQMSPGDAYRRVLSLDDLNAVLKAEGRGPVGACIDSSGIDPLADD